MKLKKIFSIVMTMLILLTSIPLDVNFADTNMQKEQFYAYAKGLGYSKPTLYFEQLDNQDFKSSLSLNYNIYTEYNVVVYGSPHGDLKTVSAGNRATPEYRYLGYDILGHSVTNARFPNDATVTPVSDWKFVSAGGKKSWDQPLVAQTATFKTKLWNQQLTGHGATNLTPAVIGQNKVLPEDYSRIETLPGKMVQGSFLAKHKDRDGKVWYGTFDSPKLPIEVSGSITTPADTYTLVAGQQTVTVPVTVNASLILPEYIKPAQIQNVTAAYGGQTFKATGTATTSGTKNLVLSRSNYAPGTYTVKLDGVAGAILWNNEPVSKPVTKNITLVVNPESQVYVTPAAKATPDTVKFTGADIPVNVRVDGTLVGISDASKVAYWDFYCMMEQDAGPQKKTSNGPNLSSGANFSFTIPKNLITGDYYTQGFKATARVFLVDGTYYDAPAACSTYVYKSLPQPNPASTPHAIIDAPDSVKAGNSFGVSGTRSYSEGSKITSYSWGSSANKSTFSADQSTGTLVYDTPGIQTIRLNVDDALSNSDSTTKQITVLPPKPDASILAQGSLKENRKIILDASCSSSPERFPIVWSTARLTLKALDTGLLDSDLKVNGSLDLNHKVEALAKKPGKYQATLYLENTAGLSDEQSTTFTIAPDQLPLAEFYTVNTVYRDPTDSNQASINLVFWDSPVDGDPIVKRTLKYAYDSNNNGSFDDESWVTVDVSGKDTYTLKTDEVGKYKFETWAKEDFGQPTIDAFVVPEDRKVGTTQGIKVETDKIVDVANMPPSADFRVGPKPDVDILFVLGSTGIANTMIDSYFSTYIKPKFDTRTFNYKYGIYRGTISDALKSYSFKETAKRYVVYIHGAAVSEMADPIKAGNITAMLLSRDATLYGIGNASNMVDLQKLITQNNSAGKLFDDSNIPSDFSSIGDLISDWIPADIFLNLGLSSYTDLNLVKARWNALALPKLNNARIDAKITINEGITKYYDKLMGNFYGLYVKRLGLPGLTTANGEWGAGYIWKPHPLEAGDNNAFNSAEGVMAGSYYPSTWFEIYGWVGNTVYPVLVANSLTTTVSGTYPSPVQMVSSMCLNATDHTASQDVVLKNGDVYLFTDRSLYGTDTGGVAVDSKADYSPYIPTNWWPTGTAPANRLIKVPNLSGIPVKWAYWDTFITEEGQVYSPTTNFTVVSSYKVSSTKDNPAYTSGKVIYNVKPKLAAQWRGGIKDVIPYFTNTWLVLRTDGTLSVSYTDGRAEVQIGTGISKIVLNKPLYTSYGTTYPATGSVLGVNGKVYQFSGSNSLIEVPVIDKIIDISASGHDGLHALREDGKLYAKGSYYTSGSIYYPYTGIVNIGKTNVTDMTLIPEYNLLHFNGKSLLDEYKKTNYRTQASKYFLNLADGNLADLNHDLGSKMAAEEVSYLGMAKPSDQAQVNNYLTTEKIDGQFIDNSNLDASINAAVDYIIKNTTRDSNRKESILIRGEQVEYNWYSDDLERDKIIAERWRFDHVNPTYFENGNGLDSRSGQNLAAPITTFDKKGQYSGFYQVQDQPKSDPNFANYSLWTLDYPEKLLVHDKPIAFFYLNVQADGSYTLGDWSYDPDHTSRADKGLVARKWQYKEVGSDQWMDGIPASPIDPAKKYVVQLTVKDMEGAWSLPYSRVMAYIPMTLGLALNPITLPASESTTATVTVNSPVEVNRVWGYMTGEGWAEMTKINATQWQVPYKVPATKPDAPYTFYAFTDIGGNVNTPMTVLTPVSLIPTLQGAADTGDTITTTATTSKYVNKVTVRAFKGTSKEQLINLTGGNGAWSTPITIPDIADGTYNFEYVATTPNGNSQTITKQLSIKSLGITGTMLPNDPMAGDQLIFNVHTVGGVDKLELILEPSVIASDNRAAMGYAPITYPYTIPVNGSVAVKDTTFTYILWCNTPQSKTLKGVVNRAPYTFVVRAWKGSSFKDLTIIRDVTGDVRQVLKPGISK